MLDPSQHATERTDSPRSETTIADEPAARSIAAVSAILQFDDPLDVSLLLIRRSERTDDAWSGHVALPGGRAEAGDADTLHTARRETLEEVGIDLSDPSTRMIAALAPFTPRMIRADAIRVHPFVWGIDHDPPLYLAPAEVSAARWVPIRTLRDPSLRIRHVVTGADGTVHELPGIALGSDVLWGLTLRIVEELLAAID